MGQFLVVEVFCSAACRQNQHRIGAEGAECPNQEIERRIEVQAGERRHDDEEGRGGSVLEDRVDVHYHHFAVEDVRNGAAVLQLVTGHAHGLHHGRILVRPGEIDNDLVRALAHHMVHKSLLITEAH